MGKPLYIIQNRKCITFSLFFFKGNNDCLQKQTESYRRHLPQLTVKKITHRVVPVGNNFQVSTLFKRSYYYNLIIASRFAKKVVFRLIHIMSKQNSDKQLRQKIVQEHSRKTKHKSNGPDMLKTNCKSSALKIILKVLNQELQFKYCVEGGQTS